MKSITLCSNNPFPREINGHVGLLFHYAPDGEIANQYSNAYSIDKLTGKEERLLYQSTILAKKILEHEPEYESVKQLTVFEEVIVYQLKHILQLVNLYQFLIKNGYEKCVFTNSSLWSKGLISLNAKAERRLDISVEKELPNSSFRVKNILARLSQNRLSKASIAMEIHQGLNKIDKYCIRSMIAARLLGKKQVIKNQVWFYSTAYTFSKIALSYQKYFPDGFQFLVENPLTGGQALEETNQAYMTPYAFSRITDIPSKSEINNTVRIITKAIQSVRLSGTEDLARSVFLEGEWYTVFKKNLLAKGMFFTKLFKNWLGETFPKALVVGNHVFEAYATIVARKYKIPTILLQHGIIGDYNKFIDIPVDYYLIRGHFWKRYLSNNTSAKARVLNAEPISEQKPKSHKNQKTILFFTAPYDMQDNWAQEDLLDILEVLLGVTHENNSTLIIRVHPLEQIEYYKSKVKSIKSDLRNKCNIVYSQGGDMNEIISSASVALLFSSTAFMDCLRYRIPIVSIDWYDFSYKQQIKANNVFHFAKSLSMLYELLSAGIKEHLAVYNESIEQFIASTSEAQLKSEINKLIESCG